jgi:hypothetical protein
MCWLLKEGHSTVARVVRILNLQLDKEMGERNNVMGIQVKLFVLLLMARLLRLPEGTYHYKLPKPQCKITTQKGMDETTK